jgi:predicted RecA/RadA family phage recombinase
MSYTLTLRETKGEALTFTELDNNFSLLYSGSQNGTSIQYSNISNLPAGQGFGNIVECIAITPITASQVITFNTNIANTQLQISSASLSQSGSMLGIALQTGNSGSTIQVLTEGYYAVNSSTATIITPGYFVGSVSVTGQPVYFSGSYITSTKPTTTALTRPVGYMLKSENNNDGTKYIKFCPSITTLA